MEGREISLSGKLTLLSYAARLHVQNEGGSLTVQNGKLQVENADAATIVLGMGTNFSATNSSYITEGDSWKKAVDATVSRASGKSYKEIRKAHVADYQKLFGRVQLKLGEKKSNVPTDELFADYMKEIGRAHV